MGSPRGYSVTPGLYRVPDLLTEEQFCSYMLKQYGRTVEFTDGLDFSPARALGQSHPVGPVDEVDSGNMSHNSVNDPVLRSLNEMDFRTEKEKQQEEESEKSEKVEKDAPSLPDSKKTTGSSTSSSTKK